MIGDNLFEMDLNSRRRFLYLLFLISFLLSAIILFAQNDTFKKNENNKKREQINKKIRNTPQIKKLGNDTLVFKFFRNKKYDKGESSSSEKKNKKAKKKTPQIYEENAW